MIKSFIELSGNEKNDCYRFIKEKKKSSTQSFNEFIKYYSGEEFNNGNNCFAALHNEYIDGIIGVVTKEVPIRKEAFIFNFFGKEGAENSSVELLKKAVEVCIEAKSSIAKLGIGPYSGEKLHSIIVEQGFRSCYEALSMKLDRNQCSFPSDMGTLDVVLVGEENKNEYVRIHNNAFRNTPNGGDISLEELEETLKEHTDKPELIGLVKNNNSYVGVYELDIKGDTGWINIVGVHKEYWRKGYGGEIVGKCIDILFNSGVKEIKLTVISSNERAVNLYSKLGFVKDEVISSWFIKEL